MRFWVGISDYDWYRYLSVRKFDEVNFWQPSAGRAPVRLEPGAPFLFKLHASEGGRIVGAGFFAHYTQFPARVAWDAFGDKNGAPTLADMVNRIAHYRGARIDADAHRIGCLLLVQPQFFPEPDWIAAPRDWQRNIVQGRSYDSDTGIGRELWEQVQTLMTRTEVALLDSRQPMIAETEARYGAPILQVPRLGQGTFRLMVTDAYAWRCVITGERTLPALDAAHIKPYSQSGPHAVENGLLLRRDLHTLFDRGYVTVTPDSRVRMSRRIRDEFENGRDYYALDGRPIASPKTGFAPPRSDFLEWHNQVVFRN